MNTTTSSPFNEIRRYHRSCHTTHVGRKPLVCLTPHVALNHAFSVCAAPNMNKLVVNHRCFYVQVNSVGLEWLCGTGRKASRLKSLVRQVVLFAVCLSSRRFPCAPYFHPPPSLHMPVPLAAAFFGDYPRPQPCPHSRTTHYLGLIYAYSPPKLNPHSSCTNISITSKERPRKNRS